MTTGLRVWSPLYPRESDERYVHIAWHGGGAQTLRRGKRHIADTSGPRETLCGRTWRRSTEVVPDDGWTTGDCQRCEKIMQALRTGGSPE